MANWEMQMLGLERNRNQRQDEGAALWIAGAGERASLTALFMYVKKEVISNCEIPMKIMFLYCWAASRNIITA